jgi:hypothetical protein
MDTMREMSWKSNISRINSKLMDTIRETDPNYPKKISKKIQKSIDTNRATDPKWIQRWSKTNLKSMDTILETDPKNDQKWSKLSKIDRYYSRNGSKKYRKWSNNNQNQSILVGKLIRKTSKDWSRNDPNSMDGYYSRNGAQNIENVSKNDPKSMNTIRETDPKIIENDQ